MTLEQWLKLQGAKGTDFLLEPKGLITRVTRLDLIDVGKQELCDEQLYRFIDGQLVRWDREVCKCIDCGKYELKCKMRYETEDWEQMICPDCQKKQEKIKVKPCPRCGSKEIRAWSKCDGEINSCDILKCKNCGLCVYGYHKETLLDDWNIRNNGWKNLTDQLEVCDE